MFENSGHWVSSVSSRPTTGEPVSSLADINQNLQKRLQGLKGRPLRHTTPKGRPTGRCTSTPVLVQKPSRPERCQTAACAVEARSGADSHIGWTTHSMAAAASAPNSTATLKSSMTHPYLTSKFQVGSAKSDKINYTLAQKVFHSGDVPQEVLDSKRAVQKKKQPNILGTEKREWHLGLSEPSKMG
eukprot:g12619.t1